MHKTEPPERVAAIGRYPGPNKRRRMYNLHSAEKRVRRLFPPLHTAAAMPRALYPLAAISPAGPTRAGLFYNFAAASVPRKKKFRGAPSTKRPKKAS